MNPEPRILEPGQMEPPAGAIRSLFLPDREVFRRRAERFRHLAPGHPLADYLTLLAQLAEAQQEALNRFPALALPEAKEQARCREHGMPLLNARSRPRDPAWRQGLALILERMEEAPLPAAARTTVTGLRQTSEAGLEEMASAIVAGSLAGIPPQELPLVAAGLQVYWVHLASSLNEAAFGRGTPGGVCPVCGSLPMVGMVQGSGAEQGLRYLFCSLCASQWHMVRLTCSGCAATHGLGYYTLAGANGAVKAESCDHCHTYLKLLYLGKGPEMEPAADDLATLALNLLMDQEGKRAGGRNLLFHPGELN